MNPSPPQGPHNRRSGTTANQSTGFAGASTHYPEIADDMTNQFTLISVAKLLNYLPQTQPTGRARPKKTFPFPDECVRDGTKCVNVSATSGSLS
jgi:hypothetical protein